MQTRCFSSLYVYIHRAPHWSLPHPPTPSAPPFAAAYASGQFPDVEVQVQGHTIAVWPHMTVGALAVTGLIWFVTAAASGTGWSTMWLAFTSLLFLACAEAALRGGM